LARQLIGTNQVAAYALLLRAGRSTDTAKAGELGQRIENLRQRLAANLSKAERRAAERQADKPVTTDS
jgi:hypothetical protein